MTQQTIDSTIDIVWSAYRSVLSKAGSLAYASTAITSGVLMQDTMDSTGWTESELKANPDFYHLVIKPNLDRGTALARKIAAVSDRPVVAPSIFEGKPQRWSQADYMRMWLAMIEEHVTQMFMLPGWEYSNGGCEEYLKAINMAYGFGPRTDIQPLDPDGRLIPLHVGMEKIAAALVNVHDRGRKAPSLFSTFRGLYAAYTAHKLPDFDDCPRQVNDDVYGAEQCPRHIVKDIENLLKKEYGWDGQQLALRSSSGEIRELTAMPEGLLIRPEEVDPTDE